MTRTKKFND